MTLFVLDASVVVKWVTHEIYAPNARRLLDSPDGYVAPDLIFAEVSNVMWMKVRRGALSEEEAAQALADLQSTDLATVPCRELANAAYSLSVATGRSAYDAMYLALALRLDTQLITADTKFLNAIKAFPILAPHIAFIADS